MTYVDYIIMHKKKTYTRKRSVKLGAKIFSPFESITIQPEIINFSATLGCYSLIYRQNLPYFSLKTRRLDLIYKLRVRIGRN